MKTTRRGFLGLIGAGAAAAVVPALPAENLETPSKPQPTPSPLGPEWKLTDFEWDGQAVYLKRVPVRVEIGGTMGEFQPDGGVMFRGVGPSYRCEEHYAAHDGTRLTPVLKHNLVLRFETL